MSKSPHTVTKFPHFAWKVGWRARSKESAHSSQHTWGKDSGTPLLEYGGINAALALGFRLKGSHSHAVTENSPVCRRFAAPWEHPAFYLHYSLWEGRRPQGGGAAVQAPEPYGLKFKAMYRHLLSCGCQVRDWTLPRPRVSHFQERMGGNERISAKESGTGIPSHGSHWRPMTVCTRLGAFFSSKIHECDSGYRPLGTQWLVTEWTWNCLELFSKGTAERDRKVSVAH